MISVGVQQGILLLWLKQLLKKLAALVDTEAERGLKLPGSETAEHGSTQRTVIKYA